MIARASDEYDLADDGRVPGAECAVDLGSPQNADSVQETEYCQTVRAFSGQWRACVLTTGAWATWDT